ncbi:MAG TPA: polysaccharide deacetylase family protein [Gemmatimonadaceae bacterium]
MTTSVPILMYHEVSARPDARYRKYTLTPQELGRQLDWLRAREYSSVTMDDVLAAWRGERALPARPVAITFDDGGRDCIEHAVPALATRGFTATFYIVAGVVGAPMRWLREEKGLELQAADWPALWAAEKLGMRCGAHSITHPRLGSVDAATCRDELARGRAMLEDGLGHAVTHLAYPFGSFSPEACTIAHETGYTTACTTVEAIASARRDELLALPRVPILGTESFGEFTHRVRTAHRAGAMQRRLERVAQRFGYPRRPPRS